MMLSMAARYDPFDVSDAIDVVVVCVDFLPLMLLLWSVSRSGCDSCGDKMTGPPGRIVVLRSGLSLVVATKPVPICKFRKCWKWWWHKW